MTDPMQRQAAFCRRAVATTIKRLGAQDVLVNNAAFQEHAQSIGARQGSCRLFHAAIGCIPDAPECA
jgi:NAD(P)-dependent dehydrogenase (short-subunit alcohol dehydrogenase family)